MHRSAANRPARGAWPLLLLAVARRVPRPPLGRTGSPLAGRRRTARRHRPPARSGGPGRRTHPAGLRPPVTADQLTTATRPGPAGRRPARRWPARPGTGGRGPGQGLGRYVARGRPAAPAVAAVLNGERLPCRPRVRDPAGVAAARRARRHVRSRPASCPTRRPARLRRLPPAVRDDDRRAAVVVGRRTPATHASCPPATTSS